MNDSVTASRDSRPASVRPEILAPAGDWECARAAVENGADAIYFGLERFNARMRAKNFTTADLPRLMEFLHRRGLRGYVTFNTLVFADELADAATYLREIIAAGVDAAIVQDVGVCRLIRRLSPDFPIHASTQMTITSAAGVELARSLGCSLAVLARECSIEEIAKLRAADQAAHGLALPLEVFVHGALCVAYSGQCLTSESLGGRSANRGECAQACRLPYQLLSDGREVALGDRRYLLSPQDLAGIEVLPQLIRSGVASLKIEGRLKSPDYVASITRVYRAALDRALQALANPAEAAAPGPAVPPAERYELEMSFSRGLHTGWFGGIDNQRLVHARFGTKRGVLLGTVRRVQGERVLVKLEKPLKPGDGVVFDAGRHDEGEEGGRVYTIDRFGSDEAALGFGNGAIDFRRVRPGDRLWKTSDPELERQVRRTFEGEALRFQRPVQVEIHGRAGQPLTAILRDEEGHVVQAESSRPLEPAESQPLDEARLRAHFGRLGGTPFKLGGLSHHLEGAVLLPVSDLNALRRRLVAELERRRAEPKRWTLSDAAGERAGDFSLRSRSVTPAGEGAPDREPELIVLVRSPEQFEAALACEGVADVYLEFEDPKRYREAVARWREVQGERGADAGLPRALWVAPPRIFKTGEEWILQQVLSCAADGYLVRNADHLAFFRGHRRRGDFSLNVANPLAAEFFVRERGLERVTASYDLNVSQLEALFRSAPPEWLEVTLHQHMPMFHMEHCVFCAFLSEGKDYRSCGRPCDRHDVRLRDRIGAEHPLRADAGCRNTVFNNRAQTGAEFAGRLLSLGARAFRVEFLDETPQQVRAIVARYRQLLRGEIAGADLWREFKLINQLGVTRGQLDAPPRTLTRKS